MSRTRYTAEFKAEAIKQVVGRGGFFDFVFRVPEIRCVDFILRNSLNAGRSATRRENACGAYIKNISGAAPRLIRPTFVATKVRKNAFPVG